MKKILVLVCATAALSLAAGSAMADSNSIKGKIGVTGKLGFVLPADGDYGPYRSKTDTGFAFGGGVIYGIDNHFAAEIDLTHSSVDSNFVDIGVTNVSLGAQYRFVINQPQLVPYVGAGLDILVCDANVDRNVDTTVGIHASAGLDYFLTKHLALTAEAKLLLAPDTNINGPAGNKVGSFDPNAFSTTFGARYFF